MRLIDADAFDKRIRLAVGSCEEELTEDFKDGISTILEMMKTAPAVDAVEVVRCRDCKNSEHWYADRRRCFLWHENGVSVSDGGFCNYGERKEGGDNG